MLKESISKLNKALSKNPDIPLVYSANIKHPIWKMQINKSVVTAAFKSNLEMLRSLDLGDNENKNTKDVIKAATEVLIDSDSLGKFLLTLEIDALMDLASKLVLFCVTCQTTRRISSLIDDNLNITLKQSDNTFYRGHSSASYRLIPSIYRGLKVDDGLDIINYNNLRILYKKYCMTERYGDIFGSTDIDYNFCAFAQHSKAYSPFLDFTEDHRIALSFASYNAAQLNSYHSTDAALYCISFSDDLMVRDNIDIGALDVLVSNSKLTPTSIIRGKMLCYCTCKDFQVEAYLLKDKTNDRMKYQKGCFLYFQKCVIVNGILLLPVNYGRISKYTIPPSGKTVNKLNIYKTISERYPFYKYEYLMNPYKYFEEIPFI